MDFLDIRKKARERAAPARGAAAPSPAEAAAPPPPAPATRAFADGAPDLPAPAPAPAPATTEPARFTTWRPGASAAPLPPPPPPDAGPAGFTTWRPGDGAPPVPLAPDAFVPRVEPLAAPDDADPGEAPWRARGRPPASRAPERRPATLDDFFYRPDEDAPDLALGVLPGVEEVSERPRRVEEFLTFRLGAEEYAVAIGVVREVLRAPPITEVPRGPADVLGVVTIRGEVVAIFDPRRRLGLPGSAPAAEQGRIVLVDVGEGRCGLLVDAVASVVRLPEGSIEPCPQGIGGAAADCVAGIGRDRDRLFTVLDLAVVLRRGARDDGRPDGLA